MKIEIYQGEEIYLVNRQEKKTVQKLLDKDYIVIYDGDIVGDYPEMYVLAPCCYTALGFYHMIKSVLPYSLAVYNMAEIEYCTMTWWK